MLKTNDVFFMLNVKGGIVNYGLKSANEEVSQKHVHLFIRKTYFHY